MGCNFSGEINQWISRVRWTSGNRGTIISLLCVAVEIRNLMMPFSLFTQTVLHKCNLTLLY